MARADFQWAAVKVFAAAEPSDPRAYAEYVLRNTGSYPIKILRTQTSCGCTAAVNDGRAIPPGGVGKVEVSFKTLNRHGLYEEPIVIDTNDPNARESTVILRVLVRNPVEILPTLLFWQPGEALAPKIIQVTASDGFNVKNVVAACADPNVDVRLEVIKAGASYKLTVTPKTPHVKATITLTPDVQGEPPRKIVARVRVS